MLGQVIKVLPTAGSLRPMRLPLASPPLIQLIFSATGQAEMNSPLVRDFLVIPFQLAGIRIERDDAVGVEIRSLAGVSVKIRGRVADAPVDQIQVPIIRTRQPSRAAAMLPGITRPAVVTLFAGTG